MGTGEKGWSAHRGWSTANNDDIPGTVTISELQEADGTGSGMISTTSVSHGTSEAKKSSPWLWIWFIVSGLIGLGFLIVSSAFPRWGMPAGFQLLLTSVVGCILVQPIVYVLVVLMFQTSDPDGKRNGLTAVLSMIARLFWGALCFAAMTFIGGSIYFFLAAGFGNSHLFWGRTLFGLLDSPPQWLGRTIGLLLVLGVAMWFVRVFYILKR